MIRMSKPEHEVAYADLTQLLAKHADKMTALEMLAVASNMVGKLIAMQDQRTQTSASVMQIVSANIELGNQQAMQGLVNVQPAGRA